MYETITFEVKDRIATIILNRPKVRNAFNWTMIEELFQAFRKIKSDSDIRIAVLTGEGTCFCAGADLNWMKDVMKRSYEENYEESLKLAELFYLLYTLPKPLIGMINGPAIGGGTGFVSVCDIAIASENARFSFSEVRIGLVPSDISPFMIRKCGGEGRIREYFLTGRRLTAEDALNIGLVNKVVPDKQLVTAVQEITNELLQGSPNALRVCKELLEKVPLLPFDKVREYTAQTLAHLRKSEEAQEGMNAFLEKRKPKWQIKN
ncbi:MAG: enoyl-CoA hydratase/isomerase family protein [Candidatus Cloacimonadota bacterium]|nr:MAG: enoyl-CoA hydratase/isomerase family protein [Candidatus Cloacimonadota bacterium]